MHGSAHCKNLKITCKNVAPQRRQKEENKMAEKKQMNKKALIGVVVIIVLVAVMGILYSVFREKPVQGSKSITIEVVDSKQESKIYELNTDAEYLQQAMDEAEGLEYGGYESEYGFTITTINGVEADFTKNNAYWSFYVNDEYCNYGISEQPVEDGDAFKIAYEVYTTE